MASELENWARTERQCIREEITWLKGGGKLISPSGDDITNQKLEHLAARLEHVQKALDGLKGTSADPMADIIREMGKTPQERSSRCHAALKASAAQPT